MAAWLSALLFLSASSTANQHMNDRLQSISLNYDSPTDPQLQAGLEKVYNALCAKYGLAETQAAVGLLDLRTGRLAMINPDREEYAASIPKIGILLAYFALHTSAATNLDARTALELGLMTKASDNEMASQFSVQLGLKNIQHVLNTNGFYNAARGGGIWMGKHYGKSGERYGDPVGDNSHAATVRQLLRYFLLLEQGRLISPQASQAMRQIFESPQISHDQIKFVKGLAGRDVQIIRKWGSWEDWLHDVAVVSGQNRHYILAALTRYPRGDEFLEELACSADDLLTLH